jgi:S1-C subfamily serine protease
MKKHIISLYSLVVILVITNIITLTILVTRTNQLSQNINSTYNELKGDQDEIAGKINEISETLMSTHLSIEKQLAELKAETSADFSDVIEQSLDSVVTIITDVSQGTGFIIEDNGYVVTNAHILNRATRARVITSKKDILNAQLLGFNITLDIALLKISGNYEALELSNEQATIGEKVIAIGNPLGLSFSVTEGIVSAVDRVGPNQLPAYIQTDVALNPGNSGGPLINKKGRAVGINNFKISGSEGIGFALESKYIKRSINEIALETLNQTLI